MGQTFHVSSKSADAPDIEPGVYDGKFDGIATKFITGGQYGDGDRWEWSFTLLDDDGDVLYDGGDPLEITGLTSTSTNDKSKTLPKALRYFKALMTTAEYAAFLAGEGIDEDSLLGRVVQVEVAVKDNGWPSIANVLPPRAKRSSKAKPHPAAQEEEAD
jgi:hypothetical protein